MDAWDSEILASLLDQQATVALCTDSGGRIVAAHNQVLLSSWLEQSTDPVQALDDSTEMLRHLFSPHLASTLQRQLEAAARAGSGIHALGIFPAQNSVHGAPQRYLGVSAHILESGGNTTLLILLREVTSAHELQSAAAQARTTAETAMALLRAAPEAARLFLDSAVASVAALRATLRMSARTGEALHDKLARLQQGATLLGQEAVELQLPSIGAACSTLRETLDQLQQNPHTGGNDLLRLAPLLDCIAHAIGNAWRIEEQRHVEPSATPATDAAPGRTRQRKHANWPQASSRRWNQFLRRHGEERGILAKLVITGAEAVPVQMRREIDEMLQHLLRNALEHGVETPEQRLAAGKPAAGQITVTFEERSPGDLRIAIRDDGRGFDMQRIAQAAVKCGLITEESLLERDAANLVGIIFKPGFTTDGIGIQGHGRGMIFLRNAVTRLNGQVSVATKSGRYTQFNLQLPVGVALQESRTPTYG